MYLPKTITTKCEVIGLCSKAIFATGYSYSTGMKGGDNLKQLTHRKQTCENEGIQVRHTARPFLPMKGDKIGVLYGHCRYKLPLISQGPRGNGMLHSKEVKASANSRRKALTNVHLPLLPLNYVTIHFETNPLGLHDVQGHYIVSNLEAATFRLHEV